MYCVKWMFPILIVDQHNSHFTVSISFVNSFFVRQLYHVTENNHQMSGIRTKSRVPTEINCVVCILLGAGAHCRVFKLKKRLSSYCHKFDGHLVYLCNVLL